MNQATGAVLASDDKKGHTGMLAKIADTLKSTGVILLFLIIVLMLVVVGAQVVRPTPTIENVAAPEAVQKLGYTPVVLAQKISDATRLISRNAERDFDKSYPRQSISTQSIEAKIPGSDFTVRSAAEFISAALAYPNKRITGEIIKLDDAFEVTIRRVEGENLSTKVPSTNDKFKPDEIVPIAAQMALQLVDPYVLAASLYDEEKNQTTNFTKTVGVLDYMIAKNENLYYAHNFKCAVLTRRYKIDMAKNECEELSGSILQIGLLSQTWDTRISPWRIKNLIGGPDNLPRGSKRIARRPWNFLREQKKPIL